MTLTRLGARVADCADRADQATGHERAKAVADRNRAMADMRTQGGLLREIAFASRMGKVRAYWSIWRDRL